MANVIGIPLVKGNSESVIVVKLHDTGNAKYGDYFEGQAVFEGYNSKETQAFPTFGSSQGSNTLLGFIFDINRNSGYASCVRAAEKVALPAVNAGTITPGSAISIDLATGRIGTGAVGERLTNAKVVSNTGTDAVDGKTGLAVAQAVIVRFAALEDLGAITI